MVKSLGLYRATVFLILAELGRRDRLAIRFHVWGALVSDLGLLFEVLCYSGFWVVEEELL